MVAPAVTIVIAGTLGQQGNETLLAASMSIDLRYLALEDV